MGEFFSLLCAELSMMADNWLFYEAKIVDFKILIEGELYDKP